MYIRCPAKRRLKAVHRDSVAFPCLSMGWASPCSVCGTWIRWLVRVSSNSDNSMKSCLSPCPATLLCVVRWHSTPGWGHRPVCTGWPGRGEAESRGIWVLSPAPQPQPIDSLHLQLSLYCVLISQPYPYTLCAPPLSAGANQDLSAVCSTPLLPQLSWDIPFLPTGEQTPCSVPFPWVVMDVLCKWTRLCAGKIPPFQWCRL